MQIKSLLIRGFKSFANKTSLQFEHGLIAIVGPNGSGKSNIVDAILWVLGEQSVKQLRGNSMEDVIFAGSSSHEALGFAEVSLILDNSDKTIPVEYSDINIGRCLYRSGESRYTLNGKNCTLTEIKEMLSEAALGRGLYSVISQGRIDEIITSKPEERRVFIDEAAGVLKHRVRKEKTKRRLAAIEEKILRANDIYAEIKRQIKPLERQAESAEEHGKLGERIRELEIKQTVLNLSVIKEKWQRVEDAIKSRQNEKREMAAGHKKLKEDVETIESAIENHQREQKRVMLDRESMIKVVESLKSIKLRLDYQKRSYEKRACELENQLKQGQLELKADTPADNQKHEQNVKELSRIRALIEGEKAELEELETKAEKIFLEIERINRVIEEKNKELSENSPTNIKLSLNMFSESLEEQTARKRKFTAKLKDVQNEQKAVGDKLIGETTSQDSLKKKIAETQVSLAGFNQKKESNRKELEQLKRNYATISSERKTLRDIYDKASFKPSLFEKYKTLGELIKVEPKLEPHIEKIFSQELVSPVVDSFKDIPRNVESENDYTVNCPQILQELDEVKERDARAVITSKKDKLKFLGRLVYHVGMLERAVELSKKYNHVYFVTDDHIVTPNGSIHFLSKDRQSILGMKRKIDSLEKELKTTDGLIVKKEVESADIDSELEGLKSSLESFEKQLNSAGDIVTELEKQKNKLDFEAANIEKDVREAERLTDDMTVKIKDTQNDINQRTAALAAIEEENKKMEKELNRFKEESAQLNNSVNERSKVLSDLSLQEVRINEKILHESKALEQSEFYTQKIKDREKVLTGQLEDCRAGLAKVAGLAKYSDEIFNLAEKEMVQKNREMEAYEEKSAGFMLEHKKLADRLNSVDLRMNALTDELHRDDVKKAEMRVKVDVLKEKLEEELESDLQSALESEIPEKTLEEINTSLKQARNKLDRMGPVNPMAIEELEEVRERERLYSDQLSDLAESKKSVLDIINELDQIISGTFEAFFEKISANFEDVVQKLFPGGRGKLSLSDVEDKLNTGIEIEIQPEGKRFRNLSLLSGGEKSMAGLAFMFSLFISRSTPFCIMDEVDAALDDINISRLVGLLKLISKRSQIVLITHQKRTMEAANVIYGVSMQADGTSTTLSQKIGALN